MSKFRIMLTVEKRIVVILNVNMQQNGTMNLWPTTNFDRLYIARKERIGLSFYVRQYTQALLELSIYSYVHDRTGLITRATCDDKQIKWGKQLIINSSAWVFNCILGRLQCLHVSSDFLLIWFRYCTVSYSSIRKNTNYEIFRQMMNKQLSPDVAARTLVLKQPTAWTQLFTYVAYKA
jgi:hypothetical protein